MKVSDEEIVAAVLSSSTNKLAAEKCGLSLAQLQSRLAQPELRKMLDDAHDELLTETLELLKRSERTAVLVMTNIMQDRDVSPQTRLNAADAIVRNGTRLVEQYELRKRVDDLEEKYKKFKTIGGQK